MITIVSDSSVALTKKAAEDLGIQIVPMTYTLDGRTFYDYFTDVSEPLERVCNSPCTTSRPVPAAYAECFQKIIAQGNKVLCLTTSSRLSGSFSSASIAAKTQSEQNIRVVDTRTTAGGMRFLVERAKELIAQNKTLDEIAATLEKERDNIILAFSVENMEPLRRSGRLGFVRQSVSTILNIRPILECRDGTFIGCGFIRGKHQQVEKLFECIPANARKIAVHHLRNEDSAKTLADLIVQKFPGILPVISPIGPVLATHTGIPMIAVVWSL
ncbi:MAG: DegV family protein [Spirochaetes bacterium]|nr:DegV family protein [Spirochaetota bacterium]